MGIHASASASKLRTVSTRVANSVVASYTNDNAKTYDGGILISTGMTTPDTEHHETPTEQEEAKGSEPDVEPDEPDQSLDPSLEERMWRTWCPSWRNNVLLLVAPCARRVV